MPAPSRRTFLGAAVAVPTTVAVTTLAAPAHAAGYGWTRTLAEGASGEDVRQLQIRLAGYPGRGAQLALDGSFGPATRAAVERFQGAYGLDVDGVAGSQTYAQIYDLQSSDDTPVSFSYAELNSSGDWSGGMVSASEAMENAKVTMWKLQALRHAMGDSPITISSGFRDQAHNDAVGGSPTSRHMYGDAADLIGSHSFCAMALQARDHGFGEILGPGYPGHDDHTHVAGAGSTWSASVCGI
ncbi:D-Ala-D-Ala carboxypeptidase family metallohydrolase [Georgenia alba]|uniref:D-Ala-D-Ala carboxypeptidase family metallohydrolase n=1 Tax=Georgenia alba TaxID=2233858 RepID=A0ABW2Q9H5_9MICO